MVFSIIIIIYMFIIISEYIPLIKKSNKNEVRLYTSLLVISFILITLVTFNVKLPNPTNAIKSIVQLFTK